MIPTRNGSGIALPELGMGCAPLGNLYRPVADADTAAALSAALDGGIRHFDTAPYYGFGLSEARLGAAIAGRDDVIVSTKVGRLLRPLDADPGFGPRDGFCSPMPFAAAFDYSHDGVLRSHAASLERLGRDHVDILHVHDIGRRTHGSAHEARLAELVEGGGLAALERLRGEGAVRAIGIGVNEVEICLDLMDRAHLDVILLAGRYTLLDQSALAELLPRCLAEGTGVVIGGPYNSGILVAGPASARARFDYVAPPASMLARAVAIEAVCARHHVALPAAALAFVLAHPAVVSVIPGLASAAEVAETIAHYRAGIPADLWAELKEEALLPHDAPVPEAARCG